MPNEPKEPQSNKNKVQPMAGWIAVGVAIGVALGAALDNMAAGIAIGIALGVALEAVQMQRSKNK